MSNSGAEPPVCRSPRWFGFIAAGVVVAIVDQLTKQVALRELSPGMSLEVIPSFFNLTLVFNRGVAFGMFAGLPDGYRQAALAVSAILALGVVVYLVVRDYREDRIARVALGMILGGAIGNLIDRALLGHVVDFFDLYLGNSHWPAFNIADSAICVGVAVLLLRTPKPASESRL